MLERALREAKKPDIRSHDHSFSLIFNLDTVLEITAAREYFGIIFIRI